MNRKIKVAFADDEPRVRDYYREIIPILGHRVTVEAKNGIELIEGCRDARPDLIITDIKMPGMDGIDAVNEICRGEPIPVILVSAHHDPELLERAKAEHILAYLVKPIKQADLEAAISIAMLRFEQFQSLRKEAGELRQALEDRKLIERAKGILMKRSGLDEQAAFRRLQTVARENNQKVVQVARIILQAEETLHPSTPRRGGRDDATSS